jgi:hypothetical protein
MTQSFQTVRHPTIRLLSRRSPAGRGLGPLFLAMTPPVPALRGILRATVAIRASPDPQRDAHTERPCRRKSRASVSTLSPQGIKINDHLLILILDSIIPFIREFRPIRAERSSLTRMQASIGDIFLNSMKPLSPTYVVINSCLVTHYRLRSGLRDVRQGREEHLPCSVREALSHAFLGFQPRRSDVLQLFLPCFGDHDPALAAVGTDTDGHPTGFFQWSEASAQGRLVEECHFTKLALADLTRSAEQAEQGILGYPQSSSAKLLVIEPGHRAGSLPQGRTQTGCSRRPAGLFGCLMLDVVHTPCICR